MGNPKLIILIFLIIPLCYCTAQRDTGISTLQTLAVKNQNQIEEKIAGVKFPRFNDSLLKQQNNIAKPVYTLPAFSKALLTFTRGRLVYDFFYRSNIDTPFVEKNVYQHYVNISAQAVLGNLIPIKINSQLRRSNSFLFRNINDVQVEFDAPVLQQNIYSGMLKSLTGIADKMRDSITGKMAELKSIEILTFSKSFNKNYNIQKLIEAREILLVPEISLDKSLGDSIAKIKSDSIKEAAKVYINLYAKAEEKLKSLSDEKDSLMQIYNTSLARVAKLKSLLNSRINNYSQYKEFMADPWIKEKGKDIIPSKYRWLLGIRKFSLGRSPVNYSELTAKNLSLNGLNFEYNSWYYVSLSAGVIDYRFRDFIIRSGNHPIQHFYMGRLGIGNLNRNFVIVSFFSGQKKIYASGIVNNLYVINTKGISLETQYKLNKNVFVKAEIAESISPDFRNTPVKNNKLNFTDKEDKAYSFSTRINLPKSHTKIEGIYKFTGANFQSFSSFQTNSSLVSWNIKAEQYLFKKQLRFTGAVKSSEFSNAYIPQQYQTNTKFKSLQIVFRKRNWPVITTGLIPISQLTKIGSEVFENNFNSFNSSIYHHYRIGVIKGTSAFIYTRFYSNKADSGFIYFNARNFFYNQRLELRRFITTLNITHSLNRNYSFSIIDQNLEIPVNKKFSLLAGEKICNLNKHYAGTGVYGSFQLFLKNNNRLSISYENSFIPGINGTLINNIVGNVELVKNF